MRSIASFALLVMGFATVSLADDWPLFRGNALQNGNSTAKIPDQLEILWKFNTKDSIEGAPAIINGIIYAGSYDEHLYAIDLKTGKQKWKTKLGALKASPCYKEGKVYIGDIEGNFYCLDAAKGEVLWKFVTQGEISSGCNFAGDRILVGSHDETLYCLDEKGKKIWDFKTQGPVNGSPSVVGDKTFVAGCDSNLHVISIKEGKELFNIDLGGQAGATAAVHGEMLYVGTMNNQVLSIDLTKQKIEWTFEAEKRRQPFYSSAAVTEDLVLAGSRDKKLYAIDRKKGIALWDWATDGRVDSSPVVAGGRVFVGSLDRTFYVLDVKKGTKLQDFELDAGILGSPSVGGGCVLVGTEKGTLYCFGKK